MESPRRRWRTVAAELPRLLPPSGPGRADAVAAPASGRAGMGALVLLPGAAGAGSRIAGGDGYRDRHHHG
eukprot:scaffold34_cov124-Isochrysis_galbana.AAC.19